MENEIKLSSSAFDNNGSIPSKYTSDGDNTSPPLTISGVSDEAKSLVIIVDDPDAAVDPDGPGKTFDHWVIFNIPADIKEIQENVVPSSSTQGKNGAGESKYIGPAPPNGEHRYFFKLYVLKDNLDLDENATKEDVQAALEPLVIGKAKLVGKYRRKS